MMGFSKAQSVKKLQCFKAQVKVSAAHKKKPKPIHYTATGFLCKIIM